MKSLFTLACWTIATFTSSAQWPKATILRNWRKTLSGKFKNCNWIFYSKLVIRVGPIFKKIEKSRILLMRLFCLTTNLNHTIWKVKFCPKIQFWQTFSWVFHPNFFLTIFLVESKLSTAKKSKTTTYSRVFHPKKSTIFSGNQSWIFGQKMKISNSVLHVSSSSGDNHFHH